MNGLCATEYERDGEMLNDEMTANRGEWKKKTYCADPKLIWIDWE